MNEFLKAMNFRHACKVFDENKEIPSEQFNDILESGRMSPSSMGVEPTRFLVIRDKNMRAKLREACWNQIQLTSASEVVVLKSLISPLESNSNYLKNTSLRRGVSSEKLDSYLERYKSFRAHREKNRESTEMWAMKQGYIAASSMMNCAAFLKIDSCAIEGYNIDDVNRILEIDTFKECVALILTFGYRVKPQQARWRLDLEQLVEYK